MKTRGCASDSKPWRKGDKIGSVPVENKNERLWDWADPVRFQLGIAERWLKRGKEAPDPFARFFFFFAGFNALYFLWLKIDKLKNNEGKPAREEKQIENLLRKLDGEAGEILAGLSSDIDFFSERRPIQRMDKRTAENPFIGDEEEGRKALRRLGKSDSPIEQLIGIGKIIYLVRSNLVHGSKAGEGDDEKIVKNSTRPLEIFLERSIEMTKRQCPWDK